LGTRILDSGAAKNPSWFPATGPSPGPIRGAKKGKRDRSFFGVTKRPRFKCSFKQEARTKYNEKVKA